MFSRKKDPTDPLVCFECGSWYEPGTGKTVTATFWNQPEERRGYCQGCAPPYDLVGRGGLFYVLVPAYYKEVTETGRPMRQKKG